MNDIEPLCAITFATVEVIDLISTALNSANTLIDIIDLTSWALSTVVIDQEVSRFTHTSIRNPILVDVTDRRTDSIASLS